MLTTQTHSAAFVTAKLTAKTVFTRIFFVQAFTHLYYRRKAPMGGGLYTLVFAFPIALFWLATVSDIFFPNLSKYLVRILLLALLSQPRQPQNTSPR